MLEIKNNHKLKLMIIDHIFLKKYLCRILKVNLTNPNTDTLVTYYYKQLGEASTMQPPISAAEKNRTILAQLSVEVQVSMPGANLSH